MVTMLAMQSRADIESAVARVMRRRREIHAGYLFGSVAAGRTRPASDVDVAVLLRSSIRPDDALHYRLGLLADLRSALRRNDIDLVILNEAPPALAHNVITKGKRVFERSRRARVRFQVRALNLFLDTEPLRRTSERYLVQKYLEGTVRG